MGATPIPEITLPDLLGRLQARERRLPLEATLETTYRCNLQCVHCYVNEPAGSAEVRARELPLERLKRLIDEIVEAGSLFLLLTGGEVLVRPDFPELYLYALGKGLLVTVFTNGTLVTERVAELFDEHRPEAIEITLYGMSQETYERVTGVPGSYQHCLAGIRRLVARGIPTRLKSMVVTWNQHEVAAMDAYARELGLPFRFDSFLNPRVDCGANRNGELQLTPEQSLALDLGHPERMQELREFCAAFAQPDVPRESEYVYTCGAGQTSFTVDPYGKLQMCQLSRKSSFDLREQTFRAGWDEFFPRLRARKWQGNSVCRACSLLSLCGSCPGAAEMETGDLEAVVPQFCTITHARAFAAMGEAGGHRADATCCLGRAVEAANTSTTATAEPAEAGCGGSCGCGSAAPGDGLIQIGRARPAPSRPLPVR